MSILPKNPSPGVKKPASPAGSTKDQKTQSQTNPLRHISEQDFVELGLGQVVFVRSISARDLKDFVPEAASMPGDITFQMIVGADGTPVLITDNVSAVEDWFSQNDVQTLLRH